MSIKKRYLTKSRFKLAIECPTKLFYTSKSEYANNKLDDSFLLGLAEGGFQVGELAKYYFPGGYDIKMLDYKEALDKTNELLKLEQVIIYEAAIATKELFIRIDILLKNKNRLDFYEVKSKSFNSKERSLFAKRDGSIKSIWKPYLYDVAFQKYVITQAFPKYKISAYLMMPDRSVMCPTDGLNQKFRLIRDNNKQKSVLVSKNLKDKDLTPPILCKINVDADCKEIYANKNFINNRSLNFKEQINLFANHYVLDKKISSPISTNCSNCEFHTIDSHEEPKLKSGKRECWKDVLKWNDEDFKCKTVLDVWNFKKKAKLIDAGCIKMSNLSKEDIRPKSDGGKGISTSQRQWLQVKKYQNSDDSIYLDKRSLQDEINSWVFPLHFIDFETTRVAIPFNAKCKPYEAIVFQFSHHIVYEDGTIKHFGEYLNTNRGEFPNYEFIRALKVQLENDRGSIFQYSKHENTSLNEIYHQLKEDQQKIADKKELCEFIRSITQATRNSKEQWISKRNMIDMLEIVKRYYYDPATNGSNSIKHVLPAILNSSTFLQDKYSKPIYGSLDGICSLNFKNQQWIRFKMGRIIDPYKMLPKMFQDISDKNMKILSDSDELNDGGTAMMAYAKMQFEEISDYEREEIRRALLKYCELDTMAMVMIYEGWRDLLSRD